MSNEEPRSTRDCGPIGVRSWRIQRQIGSHNITESTSQVFHWIRRRLTNQDHDWRAIVARSWRDRGSFEAKSRLIHRLIGSHNAVIGNRSHDAFNPPPRPHQSATVFELIFPLQACISLLIFPTFDRFVKWIKRISRKIYSSSGPTPHPHPPAFRLDCEAIGVGLITNFSLISSNFPLEFRTSTRKNPSKFTSIYENWSPILAAIGLVVRFDQLSGGNLSFY